MDLKVVFVIVFLSALAITSTHAGIPQCCMSTKRIQVHLLFKAERWERQFDNGACEINALIVYVKNRDMPFCADPKQEKFLLMRKRNGKKLHQHQLRRF